jgi:peptide/nickel transport system permease protein
MGAYVLRRLGVAVVLLFVLSIVTFAMYFEIPANPAAMVVDMKHATPAEIAQARHALGVDRPVYVQYGKYVWRALHGDLGDSWASQQFFARAGLEGGQPVRQIVWQAAKVTGSLVLGGFALLLAIAIPLGTFVATRPRGLVDRLTLGFSLAAISTHPLVVGLLLQLFVGGRWHLAPFSGYCSLMPPSADARAQAARFGNDICGGPLHWASHLALPWLTFALFFVALYLRMMRARMLEVLEEPYVRTARAKGASELQVIRRHALRNAIAPIVTMVGMDAGMAVGIALYVETVFALPGLGRTTILALRGFTGFDLPVIVGVVLVTAIAIILLNLVVDLLLYAIDPTIARRGRRAGVRAAAA